MVLLVLRWFKELIQTELHHMRTLHIMDKVFRYGMLEELQMEPGTVASMFPCLDQLIRIHSHFLGQLLQRCNSSLQGGAGRNFTIHSVGDILLEQVRTPRSTTAKNIDMSVFSTTQQCY